MQTFQSLFCWMLFWKSNLGPPAPKASRRFNPYSVGCYSGSLRSYKLPFCPCLFQSLFCWMLFWKRVTTYALNTHKVVSILILLDVILEVDLSTPAKLYDFCFNPYSVGCYSGRPSIAVGEYLQLFVSILILLDVILEGKSAMNSLRATACFNPYSVGCYSGSCHIQHQAICLLHVSILILLDVILEECVPVFNVFVAVGFQSLFCWMLFWKD